jgi:acetylglutamate kinase
VTALVLKLGGELLETPPQRARIAGFAAATARTRPLVIVHGGGRAIDAELARKQIAPRKVDGLRITDAETLDVVVSVLAGSANTELVAALVAAGVKGVGLTGVDAGFGRAVRTSAHRTTDGQLVDLGFVGDPIDADGALIELLASRGYVPVVASLGFEGGSGDAGVLNVNADVMACRIAAALPGSDLVIAGGTAGVLDAGKSTIARLDLDGIHRLIASGTATAGMVAKLVSCRTALEAGVRSVRIIDGHALERSRSVDSAPGTLIERAGAVPRG